MSTNRYDSNRVVELLFTIALVSFGEIGKMVGSPETGAGLEVRYLSIMPAGRPWL